MNRRQKIISLLELGIDPITIIITASLTLFFSIINGFLNPQSTFYFICDKGFYISMTAVLLQIVFQNYLIGKTVSKTDDRIDETVRRTRVPDCIIFPSKRYELSMRIEDILNNFKVKEMKIICYGTSKFGRIIDYINVNHPSLQLHVIVCSPEESFISIDCDINSLKSVINELRTYNNIHVYESSIPPTIRACTMIGFDDKPLFCSMQPYYLFPNSTDKIFKGEGYSVTLCADRNNLALLLPIVDSFNHEFDRLVNHSNQTNSSGCVSVSDSKST